jgi:hypothetical protein
MWITSRSPARGPCHDGRNLLFRQRYIIREVSITRISEPRGHHSHLRVMSDYGCEGLSLFIRCQRHGSHFTGSMATLAMILKNGKDVFIEGRRWRFLTALLRRNNAEEGGQTSWRDEPQPSQTHAEILMDCSAAFTRVLKEMAPQVGFEPTTLRLTAECSAIELLRSVVDTPERSASEFPPSIISLSGFR